MANQNLFNKLKKQKRGKPILVSAPMADVSDIAFRKMFVKYGRPDIFWTEFVSADGLCSEKGRKALLPMLKFSRIEKPIVAQIFGSDPEKIRKTCTLIEKLGFDGIDINMGCPDRKIEKQGAGAALMKKPELAREIILAAKAGVKKIPVSVKTRVGYSKPELETWLPALLSAEPALITIHARTRKELSKVPANWEYVKCAVEIRNTLKSKTLIFGNGDVISLADALSKAKQTGADGIMVGRTLLGNPWFFNTKKNISIKDKLKAVCEHTKEFEKAFGKGKTTQKSFALMKKFFKAYIEGFDGARELRAELMETNTAKEVCQICNFFANK